MRRLVLHHMLLTAAAAEALGIVEQGVAELEARVLVWGEGR